MKRISTNMPNDNMQFHMKIREWKMNQIQNKMGKQQRINNLRDDPMAAAYGIRYESYLNRLAQFSTNVERVKSNGRVAEGYMQEALSILQRVREITIAGANGTFTQQETAYMAEEVDQLLNELVEIGNARGPDGTMLFAGTRNMSEAFRTVQGHVPGNDRLVFTGVEYVGTVQESRAEIGENSFIETNFPGNRVFWAEHQAVISDVNATDYRVPQDGTIYVDTMPVNLKAGDTIHAVIAKINDSGAAVKAKLDPVKNSLLLETTEPHQIWLEEGEGTTVLQDLGILSTNGGYPPRNYAADAEVSGGSLFDMVIHVRDSLYEGNQLEIGGSGIRGMDSAIGSLTTSLAELGARDERLQVAGKRLDYETTETTQKLSNELDLDVAKAITDLKMLEYTHKAALQTAARVLRPTLLDFMR